MRETAVGTRICSPTGAPRADVNFAELKTPNKHPVSKPHTARFVVLTPSLPQVFEILILIGVERAACRKNGSETARRRGGESAKADVACLKYLSGPPRLFAGTKKPDAVASGLGSGVSVSAAAR